MKKGFITEKYYKNGEKWERVRLFAYKGQTFMATWDGRLIPHKTAEDLVNRIFTQYYDENGELKE